MSTSPRETTAPEILRSSSPHLSHDPSGDGILEQICFDGDLAAFTELVAGVLVGTPTTVDLGGMTIEGALPQGVEEVGLCVREG